MYSSLRLCFRDHPYSTVLAKHGIEYTRIKDILVTSHFVLYREVILPRMYILNTLMSHLLTGTKFSDFATFVFSVPWFRGSARSCHISFHSVKY